jgi:hypothetical protein
MFISVYSFIPSIFIFININVNCPVIRGGELFILLRLNCGFLYYLEVSFYKYCS